MCAQNIYIYLISTQVHSNMFRLAALYLRGGVYHDAKCSLRGPFARHLLDEFKTSGAAAPARGPALISGQKGQENLLHALAAALRRVAPHGSERDGVLDVLEEARDGRRARVAWARLVLQLYT